MEVNMSTTVGAKDFQKLVVIGEGGCGKIFLVRKIGGWDNGRLYALKQVKKTMDMKRMGYVLNERHVLERIRGHPFLATLQYAFETVTDLNIILEYANGGDIFSHKLLRGRFSEGEVKFYVAELVLALEHMHKLKIVHRDVKPENILIDSAGHVVLTDFGFSKMFFCNKTWDTSGTLAYLAPEVIQNKQEERLRYALDWWAVGVTTFELLTGRSPFTQSRQKLSETDILRRILNDKPIYPNEMSNEARHFIGSLLTKNPNHRLGSRGAQQVKLHKFLKGINWSDVANKKMPVPFLPCIMNEMDVRYFPMECTNMAINEPEDVKTCDPGCSLCPTNLSHDVFKGFSYVGFVGNALDLTRVRSTSPATVNTSHQPRHPSHPPCDTRVSVKSPRGEKRRRRQSDIKENLGNMSPRSALAIVTCTTATVTTKCRRLNNSSEETTPTLPPALVE